MSDDGITTLRARLDQLRATMRDLVAGEPQRDGIRDAMLAMWMRVEADLRNGRCDTTEALAVIGYYSLLDRDR